MSRYFINFVARIGGDNDGTDYNVLFGTKELSRLVCRCDDAKTASDVAAAMNLAAAVELFVTGTVAADILTDGPIGQELSCRFAKSGMEVR